MLPRVRAILKRLLAGCRDKVLDLAEVEDDV